jgi:hypothetical protein
MLQPGVVDRSDRFAIKRPGQVNTLDFGAKRIGKRNDFDDTSPSVSENIFSLRETILQIWYARGQSD